MGIFDDLFEWMGTVRKIMEMDGYSKKSSVNPGIGVPYLFYLSIYVGEILLY